jgi:colanic acid biosynthesis glycosyl transferase WcaI
LSAGDIHLISLDAQVQGYIVPSKLAGILAVGRPVMFLGNEQNSIAAAILKAQCGHVISEGEVSRFQELIEGLMENPERRRRLGDAARNLFDREYDRAVVVPKIIAKIEAKQHKSQILK